MIATRLTPATFAGLPPPFCRGLAGMVAENVGLAPIDIIPKYEACSVLLVVVDMHPARRGRVVVKV
jgi:hypothetical protein